MATSSKLFKLFKDQSVSIILKNVKMAQQLPDGQVIEGSVVVEGILLDEDKTYFFFGHTPEFIDEAIRKDDVLRMFVGGASGPEYIDLDDDGRRQ